jgi:hypothetical protein
MARVFKFLPQPLLGQAMSRAVAPQHFLGPLFELGIPPRRLPIARAMRLQIHLMQNRANRRRTNSGIPSVITWRARSWLDQWVMGNPFAIGSRQASWTICTRCRGGNPQRSASALRPFYHTGHTGLLITAAHSPDRARITLQLRRYRLNPFACCDRQHEPCMQDLIIRVGFGYVPFAAPGA